MPALDRDRKWDFVPGKLKVGHHITGGDVFGSVFENSLLSDHKILLPPRARGTITKIAEKGSYSVHEPILELEFDGQTSEYSMFHNWPVQVPLAVVRKTTPRTSHWWLGSASWTRFSPACKAARSASRARSAAARRSSARACPGVFQQRHHRLRRLRGARERNGRGLDGLSQGGVGDRFALAPQSFHGSPQLVSIEIGRPGTSPRVDHEADRP